MGDLCDGFDLGTKSVLEANVRERYHAGIVIHDLFVTRRPNAVPFCSHESHVSAPSTLPKPDVTHGGKLEFAHHDFLSLLEIQRACDAIDARRHAGHDG